MMRYTWKPEPKMHGTDVGISLQGHWRSIPPVLYRCKALDLSVYKAKYWNEWTTMYLKSTVPAKPAIDIDTLMEPFAQEDRQLDTVELVAPQKRRFPSNTTVFMYNISTVPYTIMDFGCNDRIGLFCEVLEILSRYDIDIKGAYINTIGNVVSNIYFITYKGQKLDDTYVEYIRNSLENEMLHTDSY
jgi:UTP:GlnB (protein PII) uridylyltransferase